MAGSTAPDSQPPRLGPRLVNIVVGTLVFVVAFLFHWAGQTFSLLNYEKAVKWGLQNDGLTPEMNSYELGIAVGDCAVGWTYGIAAAGLLLWNRTSWCYRMAWFPGVVLLYHSVCFYFWTAGWLNLGLDYPLCQPPVRHIWFGANLVTAISSLSVAWVHQKHPVQEDMRNRPPFLFARSPTVAGILLLAVGFFGHWLCSLVSVINWDMAVRLGLQVRGLTPDMKVYEYAFVVADVAIGWIYVLAGLGLLLEKAWGFRACWFGLILVYYSINYLGYTARRISLGYDFPEDAWFRRYLCFLANLVSGLWALTLAWRLSVPSSYMAIPESTAV